MKSNNNHSLLVVPFSACRQKNKKKIMKITLDGAYSVYPEKTYYCSKNEAGTKILSSIVEAKKVDDSGRSNNNCLNDNDKEATSSYCCKIIYKKNLNSNYFLLRNHRNECEILSKLEHPNIVVLLHWKETPRKIYMVMPYYCNGEMNNLLNTFEHLNEHISYVVTKQLMAALVYLHNNNVVHRDVKLENVVISNATRTLLEDIKNYYCRCRRRFDGENVEETPPLSSSSQTIESMISKIEIKLIDFGFSVRKEHYYEELYDFPGTFYYAAPEVVTATPHLGFAADVWAAGVMLYTMLHNKYPYSLSSSSVKPPPQQNNNDKEGEEAVISEREERRLVCRKIVSEEKLFFRNSISKSCINLIYKMLRKDIDDRITANQTLTHVWMSQMRNILEDNL